MRIRPLKRSDYCQIGKRVHKPFQLVRYAGSGPLELIAYEALVMPRKWAETLMLCDPYGHQHPVLAKAGPNYRQRAGATEEFLPLRLS
jgi:hypothetical protein